MKHIRIVLMAIFAQFYIVSAFSAPYCEKGSLCNEYVWSSSKNAFSCGSLNKCECNTATGDETMYPCYYPCEDETTCGAWTGSWQSAGTGVEKRPFLYCSDNYEAGTCDKYTEYQYRCAIGYYGSGSSCTRCPALSGVYGTSAAGTTSISGCYIPSGTGLSDTSGKYEFSQNCYY